jgi:hypothetical protein
MKKNIIILSVAFLLNSCSLFDTVVYVEFEHFWEDQRIRELPVWEFTTESGEVIIIEDLQYVVSQIRLKRKNRNKVYILEEQAFIDISSLPLTISSGEIPSGQYEISFVFGLQPQYNIENPLYGIPGSFLIPEELGGGYDFMQLNGQFKNQNNEFQPFEFHVTNAVNTSQSGNFTIEDTSFVVNLGTHRLVGGPFTSIVKIKMDVAEWFKNPNTWNFSDFNSDLTTNYEAQIRMKENGQNVFSILDIYSD